MTAATSTRPPCLHLVQVGTHPDRAPGVDGVDDRHPKPVSSGRGGADPPDDPERVSVPVVIICIAIVSVLLFQSISPAESYLHEYLQTQKRIDRSQMHHNVWPMYTYSHFAALIPLTIAAERYCHYPPIIILCQ